MVAGQGRATAWMRRRWAPWLCYMVCRLSISYLNVGAILPGPPTEMPLLIEGWRID